MTEENDVCRQVRRTIRLRRFSPRGGRCRRPRATRKWWVLTWSLQSPPDPDADLLFPSIHFIWANVTESIADICICICILFVLVFDALTKNANLCHQLAFKLHNWLAKTTNWWSFIARDICSDAIVATLTQDGPPLTLSDLSLYTLPATVVGRSNVIVLIFMLFSPCKSNLNLTNYMAMGLHFLRKINEWDGLNCAEYLLSQSILLHLLSFAIGQFGKFEILISIPNSRCWTLFYILHS